MAVVSTTERSEDEGRGHLDGTDYIRVFDVRVDDLADTIHTVGSSPTIPPLSMPHPANINALCIDINVRREPDAPLNFVVQCKYSTKLPQEIAQRLSSPASGGGSNSPSDAANKNPLLRPTKWSASCVKFREAARFAYPSLGTAPTVTPRIPVVNTAGEAFDPPPTRERARLKLHCTRHMPSFDVTQTAQFVGSVNLTTYLGFGPGELYFDDLHAEQQFEEGHRYVTVEVDWIIEPRGWVLELLDAGYSELIGGALKPIILEGGQRPARPVPLVGGIRATQAQITAGLNPLRFYIYPAREFADLGIF